MWLVYPLTRDDVRKARQGLAALLAGSAVWYATLAGAVGGWPDQILFKVQSKFVEVPEPAKDWTPFYLLLAGFVAAGLLRLAGYRLCRNAAGAVAAGPVNGWAEVGAAVWLAACGTVALGFTGFLAVVTAFGAALELRFLGFPAQVFGMVVSLRAARWVDRYHRARLLWLGLVVPAGLILLLAHMLIDIARPKYGPTDQMVTAVNGYLQPAFNVLAGAAISLLPLLLFWYWMVLIRTSAVLDRLLDPAGPVVPPQPPSKPGFDQLKTLIHSSTWQNAPAADPEG